LVDFKPRRVIVWGFPKYALGIPVETTTLCLLIAGNPVDVCGPASRLLYMTASRWPDVESDQMGLVAVLDRP
jgi:hypothetical protein